MLCVRNKRLSKLSPSLGHPCLLFREHCKCLSFCASPSHAYTHIHSVRASALPLQPLPTFDATYIDVYNERPHQLSCDHHKFAFVWNLPHHATLSPTAHILTLLPSRKASMYDVHCYQNALDSCFEVAVLHGAILSGYRCKQSLMMVATSLSSDRTSLSIPECCSSHLHACDVSSHQGKRESFRMPSTMVAMQVFTGSYPVVDIGKTNAHEGNGTLQLCYLEHAYTCGQHYNSVVMKP